MAGGQWASALESPYVGSDVSGDDLAGENKGVIPVKINPAGLSPDSIYFLAFRIDSFDAYEADPENNYLLYRVRTYNAWARSDGSSSYTMMGQRTEDGEDAWLRMPGSKVFYPISGNVVRTMAANEEFGSSSINLDRYAMLIEIGGDGSLKLSPYRDLEIKQVMPGDADFDAEYPNTYTLEKTSYSTYHNFLLHYRYKNSDCEWWSDDESLVRVSLAGVVSSLGNEDVTGQIELASSGSLTKFAYTTSASITLPKGRSKLKFCMDKASYNLLEMKFTYRQP